MATRERAGERGRVQERRERNRGREGENMSDREGESERGTGAWMRKLCPDDIPESDPL